MALPTATQDSGERLPEALPLQEAAAGSPPLAAAAAAQSLAGSAPRLTSTSIRPLSPGRTAGEWKNWYAFAALKSDGSVVTWGDPGYGGDSSAVADSLSSGVTQIFSSQSAFAALKRDGSVISWGSSTTSGASNPLLRSGVVQVFSSRDAFAALKSNGSVVTWGSPLSGGDSQAAAHRLSSGVLQLCSSGHAFAALKADGSVVTWGDPLSGGDSGAVAHRLSSGVLALVSTGFAFAALKSDGSVVTWGSPDSGGDSSVAASRLSSGVTRIFATNSSFAALKSDGSVITWGSPDSGGDCSVVASRLSTGVTQLFATNSAFAALKRDGSVVSWGSAGLGGDSQAVAPRLASGVSQIFASSGAFAALKADGSVVTWGNSYGGGNSSAVSPLLASGVSRIIPAVAAFAALKQDGSVISWGDASRGGDNQAVRSLVRSDVVQLFATNTAFAALKRDGSVVTWGDALGGDSLAVADRLGSGVMAFADPFHDDRLTANLLPQVSMDLASASVAEDATTPLVYTFRRAGALETPLSLVFSVSGTASLSSDYRTRGAASFSASSGRVRFAPWASTATVRIQPLADNIVESDESVVLRLTASAAYTLRTSTAVFGTIRNDDTPQPGISVRRLSPAAITSEAGAKVRYRFVLASQPTAPVTLSFSRSDASEAALDRSTLTFTALSWRTPQILTIRGLDDGVADGNVTYNVRTRVSSLDPAYGQRLDGSGGVAVAPLRLVNRDDGLDRDLTLIGDHNGTQGVDDVLQGFNGRDRLNGLLGNDLLRGGRNDDLLEGGGGADTLQGEDGNDQLSGGRGDDQLNGGNGADRLTGRGGADRFRFSSLPSDFSRRGADVITDFQPQEGDQLQLSRISFGIHSPAPSLTAVNSAADVTAALATTSQFVYDQSHGELFWNQNGSAAGSGLGGLLAVLSHHPLLRPGDLKLF